MKILIESLTPVFYEDKMRPKYIITSEEISAIKTFTRKSDIEIYQERNKEASSKKIRDDINLGKLGEAGARRFLQEKFNINSEYDLNIYDVKDKSFDGDLSGTVHVKSCPIQRRSWTFQYSQGRDPLLDTVNSKEWLILTEVDENTYTVFVRGLVQWRDVSNLLDFPRAKYLFNTKRCLYWDDKYHKKMSFRALNKNWLIGEELKKLMND